MTDAKRIIKALRCSAADQPDCDRYECPYFFRVPEDQQREFFKLSIVRTEELPDEYWDDCDADRILTDAADLIKQLTGVNEIVKEDAAL